MRRPLLSGIVALLLPGAAAAGGLPSYILFSASDVDPWQQVTQPWVGDKTFHLWFVNYPVSELQFGLGGSLEVVSFTPAAGVQNLGTLSAPQILFDAGCAGGLLSNTLLGSVVVRDPDRSGGSVCFTESATSGRFCFYECDQNVWFELTPYDLHTAPGVCTPPVAPPECLPISVEGTTWGEVKSRYR